MSRTAPELDTLVGEIEAVGGRGVAFAGDLRSPSACAGAVAAAVECFGGLQILVNNAGLGVFANVADTSDEDWDAVLGTNLTAAFRLTRAALPHLALRGGHVLMVSSLAGKNPIAGLAAYCASKAALDQFAACLMLEVRHQGVKVTTIAPGSVDTSFAGAAPPVRHLLDAHGRRRGPDRRRPAPDARRGPLEPGGDAAGEASEAVGSSVRSSGRPMPFEPAKHPFVLDSL